jgi:hypothetical protein
VPAGEKDDGRAAQESLPLLGEGRREEPVALAPDEHRRDPHRGEIGSNVAI